MAGRKRQNRDAAPAGAKKVRKIEKTTSSVTTRGQARKSLSDAVFLTTELLENILELLPMRDLLISQHVARKWRAVIRDSTKLQQALFMIPREAESGWRVTPVYDTDDEGEGEGDGRDWIYSVETVSLQGPRAVTDVEDEDVFLLRHAELNPMVFEQETKVRKFWDLFDTRGSILFLLKQEFQRPRSQRKWLKHPEASWRRMLITQPPVKSFQYHFACKSFHSPLRYDTVAWEQNMTVTGIMDKIDEIEEEDKDVFSFGDHFMSIHDEYMVCPIESDQVEIDKLTRAMKLVERLAESGSASSGLFGDGEGDD